MGVEAGSTVDYRKGNQTFIVWCPGPLEISPWCLELLQLGGIGSSMSFSLLSWFKTFCVKVSLKEKYDTFHMYISLAFVLVNIYSMAFVEAGQCLP